MPITKLKSPWDFLLHQFSALFLEADIKTFFIKSPLYNVIYLDTVLAHIQCWKEKWSSLASSMRCEVLNSMLFFSVNWIEKWKRGLCSKSCLLLVWKKEFSGIFVCGERSERNPSLLPVMKLYDYCKCSPHNF